MRVLVTGATGFAGRHLCRRLVERGHDVVGTTLIGVDGFPCPLVHCDVTDPRAVDWVFAEARPTAIVHLAAVAFVQDADRAPDVAFATNVGGTQHLIESAIRRAPGAIFVAISSAEVYGHVRPENLPVRETHPLAPANLYAVTKAAVELLCRAYAGRLRLVILRPFNHIGPGQSPSFVASGFARQIAEIEAGRRDPVVRVGNLEARRDFTDVRDVAEAYALALDRCEPDTPYNICSGTAVSIQEILDRLISLAGAPVRVERDPARLRPSDVPVLEGYPDKFVKATGWSRTFELDRTLADLLAFWRQEVAQL